MSASGWRPGTRRRRSASGPLVWRRASSSPRSRRTAGIQASAPTVCSATHRTTSRPGTPTTAPGTDQVPMPSRTLSVPGADADLARIGSDPGRLRRRWPACGTGTRRRRRHRPAGEGVSPSGQTMRSPTMTAAAAVEFAPRMPSGWRRRTAPGWATVAARWAVTESGLGRTVGLAVGLGVGLGRRCRGGEQRRQHDHLNRQADLRQRRCNPAADARGWATTSPPRTRQSR